MRNWKITGIIATIVIILSLPAYVVRQNTVHRPDKPAAAAAFVGGQKCAECHKSEYDQWRGSHHDLAMDEANEKSVL
ncbi:MAG: hypothetical protein JRE36_12085 [Deltaproteobacteria bacterium]|nr:hypothetical protein [Deltaproteobacteria bacterium]